MRGVLLLMASISAVLCTGCPQTTDPKNSPIEVSTQTLDISLESDASLRSFQVWKTEAGGDPVTVQLSSDQTWLSISPTSVTSTGPSDKQTVTVSIDGKALNKDNASANVILSVAGVSSKKVTVKASTAAGAIKVTLGPEGALSAGAKWRLDGGEWRSSGETLENVSATTHTVSFLSISGWAAPASRKVTITSNQTTSITATYTAVTASPGSLKVTLAPTQAVSAGAQW